MHWAGNTHWATHTGQHTGYTDKVDLCVTGPQEGRLLFVPYRKEDSYLCPT